MDFDIPDIDSPILNPTPKPHIPQVTRVEPNCPKQKCEVCTKQIFTCRCHDVYVARSHKGTWFCSESCWAIYAEGLGLRNYKHKLFFQQIERKTGIVKKESGEK